MADPAKRRATYEDLVGVPAHLVGEIVGGELVTSPRPAARHATAASAIDVFIGGPFRFGVGGPGGWLILPEPELHLAADVLVPDLAGWRRERMPVQPDVAAFELAPDWICEVLSPSTGALDRADKMPVYAREGVKHAWLIDPLLQTLEVFRLAGERWLLVTTYKGAARVRVEPFEAVELDLAMLWAR